MSLTRLIDDRHGPVREWFEQRLPDLSTFRARWKAAGPPAILPAGDKPPWGILGGAIDYRIRYLFKVADPRSLVAALADVLVGPTPEAELVAEAMAARMAGEDAYGNLATALAELTATSSPLGRVLDPADERQLCRYCYLLAIYDAAFRIGLSPASPLATLRFDATLDEQLALVEDVWVDDLVALTQAAVDTVGHLVGQPVTLGPVFKGSGSVGGADADLIIGRAMLELKTTKNPPQRSYLYQLVGYLLLDYDDHYDIDELGFLITRIPALITWPADELLAALAGGPVDRATLRAEFQAAIAATAT